MKRIGASISFQLIDIFKILENDQITEEEKRGLIEDYQLSLTQEGRGILIDPERKNGQCKKEGYFVFGDIDEMTYEDLAETKEYVDKNIDSFTCEAEMKMSGLISGYDRESHSIKYNFRLADKVYDYAQSHGKAMRGHTLVWHNHEPKVLDEYIADRMGYTVEEFNKQSQEPTDEFIASRKELTKEFLRYYIKTVGEHYPNCYCWDVINEVVPDVHTPNASEAERQDGLRHSKWFEYLGEDFYIDVLEIARENLPEGTKLFYNEYGEQNPEKRKAILKVIEKIKAYEEKTGKVILDGIGLQSHYDLDVTNEQLEDIYRDFTSTGKEIQVTEMDVTPGYDTNHMPKPYDPEKIEEYSRVWNKVYELVEQYGIENFTGWGVNDALSWYANIGATMINRDGSVKEFAKKLFENLREKPAEEQTVLQEGLTLQEIGKVTKDDFARNPETADKAFESLEHGVKIQEQEKDGNQLGAI